MRITIDLPETLLAEAMAFSKHKSKNAVVIAALEDYVREAKLHELDNFKENNFLDTGLMVTHSPLTWHPPTPRSLGRKNLTDEQLKEAAQNPKQKE